MHQARGWCRWLIAALADFMAAAAGGVEPSRSSRSPANHKTKHGSTKEMAGLLRC